MKSKNGLPPVHPGEIIKEDILPSAGLSVTAAAKAQDHGTADLVTGRLETHEKAVWMLRSLLEG